MLLTYVNFPARFLSLEVVSLIIIVIIITIILLVTWIKVKAILIQA